MGKIDFLLQAVTSGFHASALRKLLSDPNLERFVASVAFVRQDGVDAVANELKAVAKVAIFFVGIRNDITSAQALRRLLGLGVKVFAVDTASRSTVFTRRFFWQRVRRVPRQSLAAQIRRSVAFTTTSRRVQFSVLTWQIPKTGLS